MKRSKQALLHSMIALLLCVSMFVSTTFAWFTDEVSSNKNIIQQGNLDVELEYKDALGNWQIVRQDTNVFEEGTYWEPGHTEVVYLRVSNKGSLALKYQLGVNVAGETTGTNVYNQPLKLSDHIRMGVIAGQRSFATRDEARNAVTTSAPLSTGYTTTGRMEAKSADQYLTLVVYMPEDVGNDANFVTGESNIPTIELGINLYATQMNAEHDSFGPDYDAHAKHPYGDISFSVTKPLDAAQIDASGALNAEVTVGNEEAGIYADVPAGVLLDTGAEGVGLAVEAIPNSTANVKLEAGESKVSVDVHMPGVSPNNTTPILVTLEGLFATGLNSTSVEMFHVENGVPVQMTLVANPTNHNEFSYDPATGDITMAVATFSEYVAKTDDNNLWDQDNQIANKFNSGTGKKDDPYVIANAQQLAYFGKLVDDGKTFEGEYVVLGADINLEGYDKDTNERLSFNPIGCGYTNGTTNSGNKPGASFKGTFDGQGYTISNLYQNGWELGLEYCNLGGGLFASVHNAIIRNLTITGAEIVMECVEQGILVGLSQGTCTYENIAIYNSSVANYQKATGGLIGEISGNTYANGDGITTISNVTIGSDVVVGSLWGDFDAPVGGVIGARWDDTNTITVEMKNVTVACRLDVYNDVTSSYQWYAYRRAGMLIGNTDVAETVDGRTVASTVVNGDSFLKCEGVKVYYGSWVDYHYCEFSEEYNSPSWPYVRVEAGENCNAYSNPRWGVAKDAENGNAITDAHTETNHHNGDDHNVLLTFNQLYGGGQGVYGQPKHDGVEYVQYLITFKQGQNTLLVHPVMSNDGAVTTTSILKLSNDSNHLFEGWVTISGYKVDTIDKDNTVDYVLYPKWQGLHTVRFINHNQELVSTAKFNPSTGKLTEGTLPQDYTSGDYTYSWSHYESVTKGATGDVVVGAAKQYSGVMDLIPMYDELGNLTHFEVAGIKNQNSVHLTIPAYGEDGKEVTTIRGNAFAKFSDLTTVTIPKTITYIGEDAFADYETTNFTGLGLKYEQITILFEGTYQQWLDIDKDENWDRYIGKGSRIYFLADGTYSEETKRNGYSKYDIPEREWSKPTAGTYNG